MKKIAYHILRYIYLILGLMPIVTVLFFLYLSRIHSPEECLNEGVLWFGGTDSLFSLRALSTIGVSLFLGISTFLIFIDKNKFLPFFAIGCILFISGMTYGHFYPPNYPWEAIIRVLIVYGGIFLVAFFHYIQFLKKNKRENKTPPSDVASAPPDEA